MHSLNKYAVAAEEARERNAAGDYTVEVPSVFVELTLSSNTEAVLAWLQENGVPMTQDVNESWRDGLENDVVAIYDYEIDWAHGEDFIYVVVPRDMLVPLLSKEGIIEILPGCNHGFC